MSASDAILILSALLSVGAALGAVGITMGELFYAKAMSDNKLVECEKEYIRATFWSLKWGMSIVLLSSIGLVCVEYFAYTAPQHVLTANFWLSLTLALIVIVIGWALSRNLVQWWFGSAAAFTSWWTIFILSVWRSTEFSYLTMLFGYVVMTFVVAGVFIFIRSLVAEAAKKKLI